MPRSAGMRERPARAPFPEFHNVYIDPASWSHYRLTGEFRDGTVFAKELVSIGATAATSASASGRASPSAT